jgi:hypothetical protein
VIERLCQRDVAFRVICAGDGPDHVTISRFRAQAAEVAEQLFAQVLVLCAQLGMGQLGVVAIDSVEIASDASLAANRTEDGLRKASAEQAEIDARRARELAAAAAAEHAATDATEDEVHGPDRRGDELPEELIDPRSRAARIEQAIAELKAHSAAGGGDREAIAGRRRDREQRKQQQRQTLLEGYRAQREQGRQVPTGRPPAEIRVEVLEENLRGSSGSRAGQDRRVAGASLPGRACPGGRGGPAGPTGPGRPGPGDRRAGRSTTGRTGRPAAGRAGHSRGGHRAGCGAEAQDQAQAQSPDAMSPTRSHG